jgi:ABC-type transport system substrate-binding protein
MPSNLSRRDLLKVGGALAATAAAPHIGLRGALGQTPKRGGTISLRLWDPPHFDPHLTISYKTNILYTFTHSRLLKYKAGPGVAPGSFILEGDLAESGPSPRPRTSCSRRASAGTQTAVNGRELTADDVKYTFDRFVSEKGNAYRSMMAPSTGRGRGQVHGQDDPQGPYVWFLDMVANPMALAIIAREAVEARRPQGARGGDRHRAVVLDGYRRMSVSPSSEPTTSCPACPISTRSR